MDEGWNKELGVYLDYSIYDEDGVLVFYVQLDRDETPETIADYLERCADGMIHEPSDDMDWSTTQNFIDLLRSEAKKVPGLSESGKGK